MMNPTEIADALDEITRAPFDAAEFGFSFTKATDNARATISKLRSTTKNPKWKVVCFSTASFVTLLRQWVKSEKH